MVAKAICTTLRLWESHCWLGFAWEPSFQGLLGGAKWNSSFHMQLTFLRIVGGAACFPDAVRKCCCSASEAGFWSLPNFCPKCFFYSSCPFFFWGGGIGFWFRKATPRLGVDLSLGYKTTRLCGCFPTSLGARAQVMSNQIDKDTGSLVIGRGLATCAPNLGVEKSKTAAFLTLLFRPAALLQNPIKIVVWIGCLRIRSRSKPPPIGVR